jgi:hypothetical protein
MRHGPPTSRALCVAPPSPRPPLAAPRQRIGEARNPDDAVAQQRCDGHVTPVGGARAFVFRACAPYGITFWHRSNSRLPGLALSAGTSLVWPHPWPQASKEGATLRGLPARPRLGKPHSCSYAHATGSAEARLLLLVQGGRLEAAHDLLALHGERDFLGHLRAAPLRLDVRQFFEGAQLHLSG